MSSASPSLGSAILQPRPRSDPVVEVAPNCNIPTFNEDRPLADRESEALNVRLAEAVSGLVPSTPCQRR